MTRNYSKVPDDKRQRLIEMINMNMTIKDAARRVDIKYENAKAIYRVYRKEQRTSKRRNRFRYKLGEDTTTAAKPSTKTATKRGQAKKPKFESKMQTRATKSKVNVFEEDDSEPEDDNDDDDASDDESMLDEEEEKDSAEPLPNSVESQKRVTVSVKVPKTKSPVKNEPMKTMMAVPSKRPRQVPNSSMTVVRANQPSGQMQNFAQNAPHSTNNVLNTLSGFDPNAKSKSGVAKAWNKQGRQENASDHPKEVQLQNMVAFSDQTSNFLRAKNVTAEGVVRENTQAVPDRPIKYGNELFQLLNNQKKAIQSKDALKSNYMNLIPSQYSDYKQQVKDYDNIMNIEVPSQMIVEQAQQPSQEIQFQGQQMPQFLQMDHQSTANLSQDKKIKLNSNVSAECLDIKNQKSLTEQREQAIGAQIDQQLLSNLQTKKHSNNLAQLVTGMNQGESIENDPMHRAPTNQFLMPAGTTPPAGPLRSGNLSGSLQPYQFGQFLANNGQFKGVNMRLSQELSDFQAMNGQMRRPSINEQQEIMQRLSSDLQSRMMMAQSVKNSMFAPANASHQACKPNLQTSQMMPMQSMTTDSQRIDSNMLATMQLNNPLQLNGPTQPPFNKNQYPDLVEEKQTPVSYPQTREQPHTNSGLAAPQNSGTLPRISEMFKMPFAMGPNCNASPTRQPFHLNGPATTPSGLMQEADRQKSPHQLGRGLTQAKEHGNQVQINQFQQQDSGRLNSGNMMQFAQSIVPATDELLMAQEQISEQPPPVQNRISNLQNNLNFIYNECSLEKKQNQPKQWPQIASDQSQLNSQIAEQLENERKGGNLTSGFSNFLNGQNQQKHGLESNPKEAVDLNKVELSTVTDNQRAQTIPQSIASDIPSQSPKVTFSGDLCSKNAVHEITKNGLNSDDLQNQPKSEQNQQEQTSSVKNSNQIQTPSEGSKSGNSFAEVKKITPRLPYMGHWQASQQQQLYLRHVQEKSETLPAQGNFNKITSNAGSSSQAYQPSLSQPSGAKNASGNMPVEAQGLVVIPDLDKNSIMSEPKQGKSNTAFAVQNAPAALRHNSQQQQLYPVASKIQQGNHTIENQKFTQPHSMSNHNQTSSKQEDLNQKKAHLSDRGVPSNGLYASQNLTDQPQCGQKKSSDKVTLKVSGIIQPKNTSQNLEQNAALSMPVRRPSSRKNCQIQPQSDSAASNAARFRVLPNLASNEILGAQNMPKPTVRSGQQAADTQAIIAGQSKQRLDSCSLMLEIGDIDAKVSKSVSSSDDSSYSAASDDHSPSKSTLKPAQPPVNGQVNLFRLPYSQQKVDAANSHQNQGVSSQENQKMKHEKNAVVNEDLQKLARADCQQKSIGQQQQQQLPVDQASQVAQVKSLPVAINKTAPGTQQPHETQQQSLVRQSNKSHFPVIYQTGMAKPSDEFHKSQHIAPEENRNSIEKWSSQVGAMNGSVQAAWQQEMTELGDMQGLAGRLEGTTTAPQNQSGRVSEVTRYMLNQLDQIHIKLKSLGFTNDDLQAEPHTRSGHKGQLEQAFTIIDTFGSDVLATYKQQMEMAVQGDKLTSLSMLSSMTQVIQIMWQELKSIKSREETLIQREKALAQSVNGNAPPQIQPPTIPLTQDSPMFDHQSQNNIRPAADLPQTQAAPLPLEQLLASQIKQLSQQQQVKDLSHQPLQMIDHKITAAIAQKNLPQDIAQRLLELAVLQQAAQQHQGSLAAGSDRSLHSSFSVQNLNSVSSQSQQQLQMQQMQIKPFTQHYQHQHQQLQDQNVFHQGKVAQDQQQIANHFPQRQKQLNELERLQQIGEGRALSPETVQKQMQRQQQLQSIDLQRAHMSGQGADRHPNGVPVQVKSSITDSSFKQQQLYGEAFQGSSHMVHTGPSGTTPVQYLMPTSSAGPQANFTAWNNQQQHHKQQQQQQLQQQFQMHQAANKMNRNFPANRK